MNSKKKIIAGIIVCLFIGVMAVFVFPSPNAYLLKADVSPTFLRWVFGWNGLVKIVSPQKVCEDYRQMLENALRTQES